MLSNSIETFIAIASTESLSKAAEMLNITQSAVSLRLKNLENELGNILVDRARGEKNISLTTAGKKFLQSAEEIRSILQKASIETPSSIGTLRIGAVDSIHAFLLPPLYHALMSHQPFLQLVFETHQSWQLCDQLEQRNLDVGFALSVEHNPNLKIEPVIKEHFFVMRLLRDDKRRIIEHKELDPHEELRIYWGEEYMMWHDNLWDSQISSAIQLDTMSLITALMIRPEQWAIIPESAMKQFRETYLFQELDSLPPPRICYKITHRHPRLGAIKGLKILDELLSSFQND